MPGISDFTHTRQREHKPAARASMCHPLTTETAAMVPRSVPAWQGQADHDSIPSDRSHRAGNARVLHLVDSLNVGGTENQMVQAAVRLQRLSYQVTVGCLLAEGPLFAVLEEAGTCVVAVPKAKNLLSLYGSLPLF